MHDRWVMHRDIKLANTLLTADDYSGDALICDFGVSLYCPDGFASGHVGSPGY